MRNWKFLSGFFVIVIIVIVLFLLFSHKKVPEPPKPLQKTVELQPPKPVEPAKKDVVDIKEESKKESKDKEIVQVKEAPPGKQKIPSANHTLTKTVKKPPQVNIFEKLNRKFSSFGLNVWASQLKNNEILLNGYVKNEKERKAAIAIARQHNTNITDMINIVETYTIEGSENNFVHQPLPFSK